MGTLYGCRTNAGEKRCREISDPGWWGRRGRSRERWGKLVRDRPGSKQRGVKEYYQVVRPMLVGKTDVKILMIMMM